LHLPGRVAGTDVTNQKVRWVVLAVLVTSLSVTGLSVAEETPHPSVLPDAPLNERVLAVPGDPDRPVTLEVTLFTPDGPGPFPLAVMNHGATGTLPPRLAERYRFTFSAYYFLSRGYAVALPMMRGFAESGGDVQTGRTSTSPALPSIKVVRVPGPRPTEGSFSGMRTEPFSGTIVARGREDCDYRAMGMKNARDIEAVIDYVSGLPEIDGERVIVAGQSFGGWNTLALGALGHPKVRALINFVGGVKTSTCSRPEAAMEKAAGYFGAHTKVPSIWFYGENDKLFPRSTWGPVYKSYVGAGGLVELVPFGKFMDDAHQLLSYPEGLAIWGPKVDSFLEKAGLPGKLLYADYVPTPFPKATDYARIDDVDAVPYVDDKGRQSYREFLKKPKARVFVIDPRGDAWGAFAGFDPLGRALKACRKRSENCQVYAVDDDVVFERPTVPPPPTHFASLEDRSAIPYINDAGRQNYQKFLDCKKPRAFVIAPDGAWDIACRGNDPLKRAMDACSKDHKGCQLYAVDDDVVWPEQ